MHLNGVQSLGARFQRYLGKSSPDGNRSKHNHVPSLPGEVLGWSDAISATRNLAEALWLSPLISPSRPRPPSRNALRCQSGRTGTWWGLRPNASLPCRLSTSASGAALRRSAVGLRGVARSCGSDSPGDCVGFGVSGHDLWQPEYVWDYWPVSTGVDEIGIPAQFQFDRLVMTHRTPCLDPVDKDLDYGRGRPRRMLRDTHESVTPSEQRLRNNALGDPLRAHGAVRQTGARNGSAQRWFQHSISFHLTESRSDRLVRPHSVMSPDAWPTVRNALALRVAGSTWVR